MSWTKKFHSESVSKAFIAVAWSYRPSTNSNVFRPHAFVREFDSNEQKNSNLNKNIFSQVVIRSYHTIQYNQIKKFPLLDFITYFFFNEQVLQNYSTTTNIRKHLNFFFKYSVVMESNTRIKKKLYASTHIFSVFEKKKQQQLVKV